MGVASVRVLHSERMETVSASVNNMIGSGLVYILRAAEEVRNEPRVLGFGHYGESLAVFFG